MSAERIFTHYVLCTEPECEGHMMRVMNPRLDHYHHEDSPNWWLNRTARDGSAHAGMKVHTIEVEPEVFDELCAELDRPPRVIPQIARLYAERSKLDDPAEEPVACDPTKPNGESPIPHDYEEVGEEHGSLASGGSYVILRCRRCGRRAYSAMPD